MLIKFVVDVVGEDPGELHRLVSCLDEEIGGRYERPELDWGLRRNVRMEVKIKFELFEKRLKRGIG